MKTLNANADTQRQATFHKPRFLFAIDVLDDGSFSKTYSGQTVVIDAVTYQPFVQAWGVLDHWLDLAANRLSITMTNSDVDGNMFRDDVAGYDLGGKRCRFGLWFDAAGAAEADIVWLYFGEIAAALEHSQDGSPLGCVIFIERNHRTVPTGEISAATHPSAPPGERGKKIPLVIGYVERVPAVCISGRAQTTLFSPVGDEDTIIKVYSVEDFPNSGTIIIDNEPIPYTGIDDSYAWAGDTVGALLGCTRGESAASHAAGAEVHQQGSHIYQVAGHQVQSIESVSIDGHPVATAFSADLANGKITFTETPRYRLHSASEEGFMLQPNAIDVGNKVPDAAMVYDEFEAETAATLDANTTPLMVKQTLDVSGNEETVGAIVEILIGIEFATDDVFDVGDLSVSVA